MESTDKLNSITIEDMLEQIFTNYSVKKKRRDIVQFYESKFDIGLFGVNEDMQDLNISKQDIERKVDEVLKNDKNSIDPFLKYSSPYYSKKKGKGTIVNPPQNIDSNYLGKAGECAVMSELLFREYNVNNMMVDEGIDLVASKNNIFYYIQVKTTNVDVKNRFYFKINQDNFNAFIGTQIRYILVARCKLKNEERNIFFKFGNDDILRLSRNNVIPAPANGSSTLSLKIEYDIRTDKVYMYDGKYREDVSFYMNNFNL